MSFLAQVKPLLQDHCLPCHNGHTAAGDLNLRSRALTFRPSPNGPFIVPGHPERSKLFRVVRLAGDEPGAMPPTGHGMSQAQLQLLKGWVTAGATWPDDASGTLEVPRSMH